MKNIGHSVINRITKTELNKPLRNWLAVIVVSVSFVFSTYAQITWDGSESTDWNTGANWDSGTVPTASDNVIIPSTSNIPTIGSGETYEVNDLTVQSSSIVRIGPNSGGSGSTLVVNGNCNNEGVIFSNDNSSFALFGTYTTTQTESFGNNREVYGDLSYSIFSVPFSDGSIDLFNGVFSYEYDNSTGDYNSVSFGTSTTLGKGYFVAISDGSGIGGSTFGLGFAGTPNDSDIDIAVSTGAADNFNLVGNPYTAAISVSDFLANTNNTNNTTGVVYFWDDGGSNTGSDRAGDYITVNSMGTVGTNNLSDGVSGVKGTSVYNGHVLTMQGFYVEATTNGNVSFTQDMQVSGNNSNSNFYRTEDDNRFKVKLSLSNGELYNELLIGFDEAATFDDDYSLDAKKLSGNDHISFYALNAQEKYAILALPELSTNLLEIDLGFDIQESDEYTLAVEDLMNVPEGYTIWLEDTQTEESYNLSDQAKLIFKLNAATESNRFYLRLQPAVINQVEESLSGQLSIIRGDANGIEIQHPSFLENITIHDLSGKVILDKLYQFQSNRVKVESSFEVGKVYVLNVGEDSIKFILK